MLTAAETSDRSWQDSLPDIQLAINCTISRVTKASPLELLVGKIARPINLLTMDSDEMQIDLPSIREQAARGIEASSLEEKARFDKSTGHVRRFTVGEFVLLENHEKNQTKLDPKFKGPLKIIEVLEGDR